MPITKSVTAGTSEAMVFIDDALVVEDSGVEFRPHPPTTLTVSIISGTTDLMSKRSISTPSCHEVNTYPSRAVGSPQFSSVSSICMPVVGGYNPPTIDHGRREHDDRIRFTR
jgi:hypothetical protein